MAHFAKKHEKSSIWRKLATFSRELSYFVVWVNFSAKSCRWCCLISRKSMINRQFGQNLQLFCRHYHVSAFGSTFRQKVARSASFREKPWKFVDLAKTCNFLEQTTTVRRLGQLLSAKVQKVAHFAKEHEKSSIWPKLATFSRKLPYFVVWVNFSAKSCRKCLISRKSMKNCRFGQNLQRFRGNYNDSSFG